MWAAMFYSNLPTGIHRYTYTRKYHPKTSIIQRKYNLKNEERNKKRLKRKKRGKKLNPKYDNDFVVLSSTVFQKQKKRNKQEQKMLKQSIFTIITGLLHSHFPYIINHHKHLDCCMQLYNRMTAQVLSCPKPCDFEWTSRSFKLKSWRGV